MSTSEFEPGSLEQSLTQVSPTVEPLIDPMAHLSPAQIEEIYKRYFAGEKTGDLIREFDVKTNLSSLLKLFPLVSRADLTCPYCSSPATQRRRAKLGQIPLPACTGCAHVYETFDGRCGCEGCRHAFINKSNGEGLKVRIPYADLTIREKIILLSALTMENDLGRTSFSIYQLQKHDPKFAPTPAFYAHCQNKLFARKIILISEETTHSTLELCGMHEFTDFLLWRPNVSASDETGKPLEIDLLRICLWNEFSEIKTEYGAALIELMYELAIEELMEYLAHMVSLCSVNFKAWAAARSALKSLLPSKSISEIFGFIWGAVKGAEKAIGRKNINGAAHAGNLIPSNIIQAAEAFEARPPKQGHREFFRLSHIKPSQISNTIYKLILGDKDGAFKIPLPRYISEIMQPTLEGITTAKAAKAFFEQ